MLKRFLRSGAIGVIAFASIGASGNWNTEVEQTDRAYVLGDPEADVTLTEFVSYTCPHCATFTIQGEAPLQMVYIGPGKLKLEVRSIIRNVVDETATLLVQCGSKDKFLRNHTMFMLEQRTWLAKARSATQGQIAMWTRGDALGRKAMASTLGFYDMMATRGYERVELDGCLSDNEKAAKLKANTRADFEDFGIAGTPSFAIDGTVLEGVHSWQSLGPAVSGRFKTGS